MPSSLVVQTGQVVTSVECRKKVCLLGSRCLCRICCGLGIVQVESHTQFLCVIVSAAMEVFCIGSCASLLVWVEQTKQLVPNGHLVAIGPSNKPIRQAGAFLQGLAYLPIPSPYPAFSTFVCLPYQLDK